MSETERKHDEGVRFKLRSDLEMADYALGFDQQLVIKDPLRLQYFLFQPFEKALLGLLRSPMSVFELKQAADQQFAPARIELPEIKKFLRRLLNDNLLIADRSGNGSLLLQQNQRERKQANWQRLLGVLAIRFRGINPQSILDRFSPFVCWVFQPMFMVLTVLGFTAALVAVGLNFTRIFESDFLAQNLTNPRTALAIMLALGVVKVLHELGHAFACRSIGRDCHELGVMLLAFMPCLYCNVSDAWMEPNRWKRIMVSAAGIYVEMLIATLCVPMWLLSHAGPMQAFWFAMITICSINTLLINGNPLLRYDGYYVLSDLLQIPNLYSSSQQALNDRLSTFFTRVKSPHRGFGFLECYAVAAKFYRLFVVGIIMFVIYSFFANYGLNKLGKLVTGLLIVMTFAPGCWRGFRRFSSSSFQSSLRIGRAMLVLGFSTLLIGLVFCIPVTIRTFAEGETELAGTRIVYAPEQGRISWLVDRDDDVLANQIIGHVENSELELELLEQRQRVRQLALSLRNQELLKRQGADNAREVELQSQALTSARRIEEQLLQRVQRLDIRSAAAGKLVAFPEHVDGKLDALDLTRTSTSIAIENNGCSVQRSEPIAAVYAPEAIQVRLRVAENQIGRIAEGSRVQLIVAQTSPEYISGVITSIDIEKQSQQLQAPGRLTSEPGSFDSVGVIVALDSAQHDVLMHSSVKACVYGKQLPIYKYLWQEFVSTLDL